METGLLDEVEYQVEEILKAGFSPNMVIVCAIDALILSLHGINEGMENVDATKDMSLEVCGIEFPVVVYEGYLARPLVLS